MIQTVADLLEQIKSKGLELLKRYEIIDHPVLIGDMYEGLTHELLNQAVFEGLNLKVVGGKIKNSRGTISGEIDCMIVEGEGEQIPFTDKHIYHFSQVIAVIEVKKSLYSNTLGDSYFNLKTVIDVSREPEKDGEPYIIRALRDSWRSMLRIELPRREELESFPLDQQYIYHTLLMEAYFPLRIVFGYFGFKTEFKLRESFANFLGDKAHYKPARGFGVGSLPSLIICGGNSIIKNNGMPYGMPFIKEEFYWPIYVTSPDNPIHHLLEFIWTRLSYKFGISSSIFGADFDFEPVHRYINCKVSRDNEGNPGWEYKYYHFSHEVLNQTKREKIAWTPSFLTKKQFIIILQLCQHEYINIEDEEFKTSITEDGTILDNFINQLVETGLVYQKGNEIRLLTDECQTLILPDGRFCAGENKNGELSHWLNAYIEKRQS